MLLNDRSRILSLALAAFLFCAPAENFAANEIKVEAVSGLTLSGYDNDDELKWTIAADSAELKTGSNANGVDALKNGEWDVRGLKVKTFSAGNDDVTVTSRTAVFFPKQRRAEGKELVEVKDSGKRFYVKGTGWFWQCDKASDINTIAVTNGVSVELYDTKASAEARTEKTIKVSAQRLEIRLTDNETILKFGSSDGTSVKVTQGDVVTSCKNLEVVIPQSAHEMDANAHGNGGSEEKNSLKRIKKIAGNGNVVIAHQGRKVCGDNVELIPDENRFFVNGNVSFNDAVSNLKITGEKSVGIMREANDKYSLEEISIVGKNNAPIEVTTQSLEKKKLTGRSAVFTGKKLTVAFPREDLTTVCLEKDVRFKDFSITLACDKLEIDSLRGSENQHGKNEMASVREIRARGNVKATQDGTVCECDNARIDAEKEMTFLSGNPRVSVPAENFSLVGDSCEIDRKNRTIRLYKRADGTPICATIGVKKSTGGTLLQGDFLEVSRDPANMKNVIFDLSGNVSLSDSAGQLSGTCDRLRAGYEPPKSKKRDKSFSALQKIEALGNVKILKEDVRIAGGKILMFNNIVVSEWIQEDNDGSDGKNPMQIKVLPGDEDFSGPRPTIVFPQSATSHTLNLPLPGTDSSKKNKNGNREICVEGDELETIVGERRIRFWLRENVVFTMDDTRCTCAEFEAEMRRADTKSVFEPEALFCRKDVKISRQDAYAFGNQLEIFPKKQIGFLSGNAYMQSEKFGKTTPGKSAGDRFILDLNKREVRMEMDPKLLEGTPAQVARPRTMLPKNIRDEFSLKLKKSKNDKNKK